MTLEATLIAMAIASFVLDVWALEDPWPRYYASGIVVYKRRHKGGLDLRSASAALGTDYSIVETAAGHWAIRERVLKFPVYPMCMHCGAVSRDGDTIVRGYLNISIVVLLAIPVAMGSIVGTLGFMAIVMFGYVVQRVRINSIASTTGVSA